MLMETDLGIKLGEGAQSWQVLCDFCILLKSSLKDVIWKNWFIYLFIFNLSYFPDISSVSKVYFG